MEQPCVICGKVFDSVPQLSAHKKLHTGYYRSESYQRKHFPNKFKVIDSEKLVRKFIEEGKSIKFMTQYFQVNYNSLKKAFEWLGIDYKGASTRNFPAQRLSRELTPLQKLETAFENGAFKSRIKELLFESGLKKKVCEKCKRKTWNGEPIPLELHHINGKRNDNHFENLMILCLNCHAQTDNYRSKNKNASY